MSLTTMMRHCNHGWRMVKLNVPRCLGCEGLPSLVYGSLDDIKADCDLVGHILKMDDALIACQAITVISLHV